MQLYPQEIKKPDTLKKLFGFSHSRPPCTGALRSTDPFHFHVTVVYIYQKKTIEKTEQSFEPSGLTCLLSSVYAVKRNVIHAFFPDSTNNISIPLFIQQISISGCTPRILCAARAPHTAILILFSVSSPYPLYLKQHSALIPIRFLILCCLFSS